MLSLGSRKLHNNYKNYGTGSLDIGKHSIYCYAEGNDNNYIDVFPFDQNIQGYQDCLEKLEQFKQEAGLEGFLIGVESTSTYGDAVTSWMIEKGINVVGINPKHVHRLKEVVDNSPSKTDKKDPKVGTLIVQNGRFHQILVAKGIAADLRVTSKHRMTLMVHATRLTNQIESHVVRVFPEFIKVMKGLKKVTSIYLLGHYTLPEDIVKLGEKRLYKKIRNISRYQLGISRANQLYSAAKKSIGVKQGALSTSKAIKSLVKQLNVVQQEILLTEIQLKELLLQHEEGQYLLSMPGVGLVTASELIGETGGLNNYSNINKLMKVSGLNLYEISSGLFQGRRRITKRGRGAIRHTLYLTALRAIKKNGIFRKEYVKHLKTMKKPQAVIAIAKKILGTLYSLVKHKNLYDKDFVKVARPPLA